jgi:hypothetical protein
VKLHTLTLAISITPDLRDEDLLRRNHLKFLNILDFIDGPLLEEITFQTTCTDLKSFDCVAWLRFQEQFGRMDYNSPALPSMQTVRFVVSSSTLNDHRGERGVVYDERRFQDGRPVIGLWTCFFRGWASPVFVAALIGLVCAITNKFL